VPKRHLFRALCATLTTLLVIGLAGIPRPAAAITWYAKPCIGFDQCEDRGYGNGGYSAVYKKAHWNMYGGHNCTNYVAYRLGKRGVPQFTVPGRGNARYWGEHARTAGYAVDRSPRKGDVAWWYDNMGASGHVALVESVNLAAGTVVVSEDHWQGNFNWRTYLITDITGFLHVGASASVESPPATTPVTAATPKITGTAQVGRKLTANPGTWESGASFAYQWLRDKKAISGATGKSYTLSGNDLDAQITVKVTGSKPGFLSTSKTSKATANVAPAVLTATPVPTIQGEPKVLKPLTAASAAWEPAGVTLSYQWQRDGKSISGAKAASYTPTEEDEGAQLRVKVTGKKLGYTSVSTVSEPTAPVAAPDLVMAPAAKPTVKGTVRVGEKLTAKSAAWAPAPVKLGYTWLRNGKAITGATTSSYTLTAADLGKRIAVTVAGSKVEHLGAAITSEETAEVAVGVLSATPKPTISGTAKVGRKQTAKAGEWGPSDVKLTYQWRRDGKSIKGATKAAYTLTADDLGAKITVKVKGAKDGFTAVSKTSSATKKVGKGVFTTAPTPTISGTVRIGQKLKAKAGTWKPGTPKLAYVWLRDGVAIPGAKSSSYTLRIEDLKAKIAVKLTGSQVGFTSVSTTSAATAAVKIGRFAPPVPVVSGRPNVLGTLTVDAGKWSPSDTTVKRQWLRDGVDIVGATGASYTLVDDDLDAAISVRVTGSRVGFTSAAATSVPVTVKDAEKVKAAKPTITGTAKVGKKLTAKPGAWGPAPVKFSYQWRRDGVVIEGATSSAYTLVEADKGAKLTVKVTGNKTGYLSVSKTSKETTAG
jgi:surface antigen